MKLTLNQMKDEAPGVKSFLLKPQERLNWRAGQFMHYTLHHEPTDDRGSDRYFTISSAPFENHIMITTRFSDKSSSFKNALRKLKIGDEIEAEGPDGEFTMEDPGLSYVFIAGGIGITPFRSILLDLDHNEKNIDVVLVYSNRDENIPFRSELDGLKRKHRMLEINYLVGERLMVDKIKQLDPGYQRKIVFLSGPEPMVENLGEALKKAGLPEQQLKQDWFPGYPAE